MRKRGAGCVCLGKDTNDFVRRRGRGHAAVAIVPVRGVACSRSVGAELRNFEHAFQGELAFGAVRDVSGGDANDVTQDNRVAGAMRSASSESQDVALLNEILPVSCGWLWPRTCRGRH